MSNTRELLLDLGEQAVRERGYSGFSYADLAEGAGIRKASVHHHFPAKTDLGLALVERYSAALDETLGKIVSTTESGGEALAKIIALYRDALSDGEALCLCCAMAGDTAALSEPIRRALDQANEKTVMRILEALDRGQEDGSLADATRTEGFAIATLATLQGAQLLARAAGDASRFDIAVAALRATIIAH